MNIEYFIAKRIIKGSEGTHQFSRPIVRIAILGVALGIAVMILSVSVVTGFQNEIKNKLIGFGSHIQITNYDSNESNEPAPISIHQDFISLLKTNEEIKHIQTYAIKNGIIKTKTENEGIILKGVNTDYNWNYIKQNLKEGSVFTPSDTINKGIVISQFIANELGFKLNDKIVIYFIVEISDSSGTRTDILGKDFYVSGIFSTGFDEIDKNYAIVDIHRIQKINRWDTTQIAGFEVELNDYKKIDEINDDLNIAVGTDLMTQTIKQLHPTLFSWLDMIDVNAILVLVLMVLVASINMIATLLILILERTNMIGILKSLGSTNQKIQKIFLYNAIYIIGKGLLWGNGIAILISIIQLQFGIFTLNPETYYISQVPINFNILHILFINAGTLLVCTLMLLLPSLVVSKITPVKAIKFD